MSKDSTIVSDSKLSKKLIDNTKIHENIDQEIIITTKDKLELCLNDYTNKIKNNNDWLTPFSIFLAIAITLLTASFKTFFISAELWQAIFVVVGCVSLLKTILALIHRTKIISVVELIDKIQKKSISENKEGSYTIYIDNNNKVISKIVNK